MVSCSKNRRKGPPKLASMKQLDNAYNRTHSMPPCYSMRPKIPIPAANKNTSSETAGPLDITKVKRDPPKYTMRKRTCKMLQLPGQTTDATPSAIYKIQSTLETHPTLITPGRVTLRGPPRFDPNPGKKPHPGPADYQTGDFYKILSGGPKKQTMGQKLKDAKRSLTDAISGPLDASVNKRKPPQYTMAKRTCKMLQLPGQTSDSVPGPGTYPMRSSLTRNIAYKSHGVAVFGACERFIWKDPEA